MVGTGGVEPARPSGHVLLRHARLPIPPCPAKWGINLLGRFPPVDSPTGTWAPRHQFSCAPGYGMRNRARPERDTRRVPAVAVALGIVVLINPMQIKAWSLGLAGTYIAWHGVWGLITR